MVSERRKKILFLITKSNWGGAQRYVFDLATHLDATRFEAVVAAGGDGPLIKKLQEKGVRVIPLNNFSRDISLIKEVRAVVELWRVVRAERPSVLHINSSKAGGLGALIGRIAMVPLIIFTAHGWAFNEERPLAARLIIKLLHACTVLLAHKTIAVSAALKAQLDLPFVARKMTVIHNGHDSVSLLDRSAARLRLQTLIPALTTYAEDPWSITIGELHPIKQHHVMIRAMREVAVSNPRLRHIIIGDGEERNHLKALVTELNLEDRIFFAGYVPEASALLPAGDVFVLPSRSEALAYVIIEACAAGTPIVASNVGGIPEIITHGKTGLLVPQGESSALAHAITQILTDQTYRNRIGSAAKERSKDFSLMGMVTQTVALYDSTNSRAM